MRNSWRLEGGIVKRIEKDIVSVWRWVSSVLALYSLTEAQQLTSKSEAFQEVRISTARLLDGIYTSRGPGQLDLNRCKIPSFQCSNTWLRHLTRMTAVDDLQVGRLGWRGRGVGKPRERDENIITIAQL